MRRCRTESFSGSPSTAGASRSDYREGISLGLLKNGITNLNTTDYKQIGLSRQSLEDLTSLVNLRIATTDYSDVPAGQTWITSAWSGDMAAAPSYMPKGVNVDVIGYWFPADGRGPINNDTNVVLKTASNPYPAGWRARWQEPPSYRARNPAILPGDTPGPPMSAPPGPIARTAMISGPPARTKAQAHRFQEAAR